jgi:hypothetical protein
MMFLVVSIGGAAVVFWTLNIGLQPSLSFSHDPGPAQQFEYELKNISRLSESMLVYKFASKKIDSEEFKRIARKFSMNPKDGEYKYTPYFGYFFRDSSGSIRVGEDGRIQYLRKNASGTIGNIKIKLPTDNEAKTIAEKFLADRGLLPPEFSNVSVREGTVSVRSGDFRRIVENKLVGFQRTVDGKKVLGVSRIMVYIGDRGIIEKVFCLYRDLEPYRTMGLKTVKKALKDMKAGKGLVRFDVGISPIKCVIESIELAYFEKPDSHEQPYLYPVYSVTGKVIGSKGNTSQFIGVISATKDSIADYICF